MDSVLVVLVVIAVIMILVGVARMKNKRAQNWDDVDHNVLFEDDKAVTRQETMHFDEGVSEVRVISNDADVRVDHELKELGSAIEKNKEPVVDVGKESVVLDQATETTVEKIVTEPTRVVSASEHTQSPPKESETSSSSSKFAVSAGLQEAAKVFDERRKAGPTMRALFDKIKGEEQRDLDLEPIKLSPYKDDAPEWIIVLNVKAKDGHHFNGLPLQDALKDAGFSFGDMDIFHYLDKGVSAFSVANMVKPGTFDVSAMDGFTTPGVSLFMQFPNDRGEGVKNFKEMMRCTHQLAARLEGEVSDERRSVLTNSGIDHLLEQVAAYEMKWRVSS